MSSRLGVYMIKGVYWNPNAEHDFEFTETGRVPVFFGGYFLLDRFGNIEDSKLVDILGSSCMEEGYITEDKFVFLKRYFLKRYSKEKTPVKYEFKKGKNLWIGENENSLWVGGYQNQTDNSCGKATAITTFVEEEILRVLVEGDISRIVFGENTGNRFTSR